MNDFKDAVEKESFDVWALLYHDSRNKVGLFAYFYQDKPDFGNILDIINEIQQEDKFAHPFIALLTGHDHILYDKLDEKLNARATQAQFANNYLNEVFLVDLFIFSLLSILMIKESTYLPIQLLILLKVLLNKILTKNVRIAMILRI